MIISGLRKRVHQSFIPGLSLSVEDKARGKLVAILIASPANSNSGIFLCSCKYYVVFPWLRQRGQGAVVSTRENFAGRESAIAVACGEEDDGVFSDGGRLAGWACESIVIKVSLVLYHFSILVKKCWRLNNARASISYELSQI